MYRLRSLPPVVSWLLLGLPILGAGLLVGFYAVNLPYWDDYLVQDHLASLKAQGSWRGRISHLFDQHWEHRIVWTRLVFAAYYALTGSLNYVGLTWIGFSGLLVLTAGFWRAFRRFGHSLAWFIPVPYWLFSLESHENLIWAMASVQNVWILVFALGTFAALATNRFVPALLLGVLATYTSGNGALVLAAGLGVLLWQRQWTRAGGWAVLSAATIGAYFYHYQRVTFFPSPFRYPVTAWIEAIFVFFGGFLDPYPYTGSAAFGYTSLLWPVVLLGIVLLAGLVYFGGTIVLSGVRRRPQPGNDSAWLTFFLGTALFLLGTAAITVYARVGFAGPAYLLQSRYKIYAGLTLVLLYLHTLRVGRPASWLPWFGRLVGVSTVLFAGWANFLCLEGLVNQHRRTVAEYASWRLNTPVAQQQAVTTVFTPTHTYLYEPLAALLARPTHTLPGRAAATLAESPPLYTVSLPGSLNPTLAEPLRGTYLLLTDSTHTYVVAARPLRPGPLAMRPPYFTTSQSRAQVLKEKIEPGRYQLSRLRYQPAGAGPSLTRQSLEHPLTFGGQ